MSFLSRHRWHFPCLAIVVVFTSADEQKARPLSTAESQSTCTQGASLLQLHTLNEVGVADTHTGPSWSSVEDHYCEPFPGDTKCRTDYPGDDCFPTSSRATCQNVCAGTAGCEGVSHDKSRGWCILCRSVAALKHHSYWDTFKKPFVFTEFAGKWVWKGMNVASRKYEVAISKTKQSTYQNAVTAGVSVAVSGKAKIPFVSEGGVEVTVSAKYTRSWSNSVTQGITFTVATTSPDCSTGNLFQYGMQASGTELVRADRLPGTALSFVCIDRKLGSHLSISPRCPGGHCYDTACQCCSDSDWAEDSASAMKFVAKQRGGSCETPSEGEQAQGTWTLSGSGCTMVGNCVQSNKYPSMYGNNDRCTVTIKGNLNIKVEAFNTEARYDFLTVDGKRYSGSSGPASGSYSGSISWASDYSVVKSGWKLCKV